MADRTCEWSDCEKTALPLGLCPMHYQRKRTGRPMDARNGRIPRQCAVDGCERRTRNLDWCDKHYRRWKQSGDPTASRRELAAAVPFVDRLPSLVLNYGQEETCWPWQGHVDRGGYGSYYQGAHDFFVAHRLVYETLVGPIAPGMHLDHVCHDPSLCPFTDSRCPHRRCVNPEHLVQATPRENALRSKSAGAVNARKTHCKRGHPFEGENLIRTKQGRSCRTCIRDRARENRRRAVA